jgi:hypothetical protein
MMRSCKRNGPHWVMEKCKKNDARLRVLSFLDTAHEYGILVPQPPFVQQRSPQWMPGDIGIALPPGLNVNSPEKIREWVDSIEGEKKAAVYAESE